MNNELLNLYQSRKNNFLEAERTYQSKTNVVSNIRLGWFLGSFLIMVFLLTNKEFFLLLLAFVVFVSVFIPLIIRHKKLKEITVFNGILALINDEEIKRLKGEISELPTGSQYYQAGHPYVKDLDIFGKGSLFQYLNRCSTEGGYDRLADSLMRSSAPSEINLRQEAINELLNHINFRQELQALGRIYFISNQHKSSLLAWLGEKNELIESKWFYPIVLILNVFTISTIIAIILAINWKWIAIPIAINAFLLSRTRAQVTNSLEQDEKNTEMLKILSAFLIKIEMIDFKSEKLRSLKESIVTEQSSASKLVKKLSANLDLLGAGRNPYFYLLFNFTFLWDLHWLRKTEIFKKGLANGPANWFESLSQLEMLSSFSGLYQSNPDWIFPDIVSSGFVYEAKEIAHPLIFSENRISNDFSIKGVGITWIVTGSNMSGKSTFLRTLGINAVLALSGAPVSAKAMTIAPLKVFTSMRTEDSLQESTSSFYAELKRLRQLLDYIDQDIPVFYLLDEILKGTNSDDRHTGGKALVKQLYSMNATGIIATHDLDLGKLEDTNPEKVINYSFSSDVIDGKLFFDYKLKNGICKSFNATELMKQIGIKI